MAAKKTAKKSCNDDEGFICPMCLVVRCFRDMVDRKSPFFKHMNNARLEFLEGIKSLIDERIEAIKKGPKTGKSKLTKIKVED
jgi:hypothetical protein